MGLVSAFLSGPQEIIPAGQTKVELFVFTHDNLNKGTAKWQIKEGANTYNVTADAGGHGKILVPSGKTYTVTLTISGTYEGGKTTSFVANSCEVVLCHFILGDQVTKGGAQVITGAKHFSAQPTADTRAYNPANKTDLVSIKSLQESSDVVHTSGDTMSGNLLIDAGDQRGLLIKRTDRSYNSPWARYRWDRVFDKDNRTVGELRYTCMNDDPILGRVSAAFITAVNYTDAGNAVYGSLHVAVAGNGDAYVQAPMRSVPTAGDIATVKYVLDRVDELVGFIEGVVGTHEGRKDNPHAVTKAQVGLGNVHNIAPADMPISTAVQGALDTKADKGGRSGSIDSSRAPMVWNGAFSTYFTANEDLIGYVTFINNDSGTGTATLEVSSDGGNTWQIVADAMMNSGWKETVPLHVPKGWKYRARADFDGSWKVFAWQVKFV